MKKTYILVLGMVVIISVFLGYSQAQANRKSHQAKDAQQALTNDSEYQRGFMDGMNATIKHVNINTNTGKASLEMSDVLAEMKFSTNQPAWPSSKSQKKSN